LIFFLPMQQPVKSAAKLNLKPGHRQKALESNPYTMKVTSNRLIT